jgi:chromatin segregation and condensation protein Rec8/ScpA/Scc1 (kleisin family)
MNKPDWADIKSEYVETALTLAEIQAKHDIPRGTLSARATREKWHDEKQQFAANLERVRRSKVLAQRAAVQEQFEDNIIAVAGLQLKTIVLQMKEGPVDAAKLSRLADTLQKVQRVGAAAFGRAT